MHTYIDPYIPYISHRYPWKTPIRSLPRPSAPSGVPAVSCVEPSGPGFTSVPRAPKMRRRKVDLGTIQPTRCEDTKGEDLSKLSNITCTSIRFVYL